MRRSDPDFYPLIASEYVFGLIRGRARERLEHMRCHNDELDGAIRRCEHRFGSLLLEVPEREPAPALARQLRARLDLGTQSRGANPARRWQLVSALALAATVTLGITLVWQDLILPPPSQRLMALSLIRNPAHQTTFVAEVTAHARRVTIYAVARPSIPSNRTLELWALYAGKAPVAVGLVAVGLVPRVQATARFVLPVAARKHLIGLAISIEPLGGSPKPFPTGPIVGKGPMTLLASSEAKSGGPALFGAS